MDFVIRKATQSDVKDITTILSFYFLDTDNVEKNLPEFILAQMHDKIIGCACLDVENVVELSSIAILPSYRNKGVGSELVDHILKRAKFLGNIIYLRTTSPGFFEKKGFLRLQNSDKKEVWKDCRECNKYDICTQTGMRIVI